MTEMIERVARALCEADGHDPNVELDNRGGLLEGFNIRWKLYEDRAHAAIEATGMRTALLAAKEFADDEFSRANDLNRKNRISKLCDMIDEALR